MIIHFEVFGNTREELEASAHEKASEFFGDELYDLDISADAMQFLYGGINSWRGRVRAESR